MRRALFIAGILVLAAPLSRTGTPGSVQRIYDVYGRWRGNIPAEALAKPGTRALQHPVVLRPDGDHAVLPSGVYVLQPPDAEPPLPFPAADPFRFEDVTQAYLPADPWGASDIDTADLNGDGLFDILFTRIVECGNTDSLTPRILVQTPQGVFLDQTAARMPAVNAPAFNVELFDCDGDGDTDILASGHHCPASSRLAVLLVNNGLGLFTDESSTRLPAPAPGDLFAQFVRHARLDGDSSEDLALVVFGMYSDSGGVLSMRPDLWLNNGRGVFTRAPASHLPTGSYGYFTVAPMDVDGDMLQDLIFGNLSLIITGPGGPDPVDTLSGQLACYRNTGGAMFVDETAIRLPALDSASTRVLAVADVEADGDGDLLDVRFPGIQPQVRLMVNNGTGVFTEALPGIPTSATGWFNDAMFARVDEDSLPDLFLARVMPGVEDRDQFFRNTGGAAFADSSQLLPDVVDFSIAAAFCDHEWDTDADILTANAGPAAGSPGLTRLYHNTLRFVCPVREPDPPPAGVRLDPNFPNPFNPFTVIGFSVGEKGLVSLRVYDLLGRSVAILFEGETGPGSHRVGFDASGLAGGMYVCRLTAAGRMVERRLLLIR